MKFRDITFQNMTFYDMTFQVVCVYVFLLSFTKFSRAYCRIRWLMQERQIKAFSDAMSGKQSVHRLPDTDNESDVK